MRVNIQALINSNITAYRVAKDTNITLSVVQKILDGTSKLDNISLKNAEILSNYWEENKMKTTFEKVLNAIEGKREFDNSGVTYYENAADFIEQNEEKGFVEVVEAFKNNEFAVSPETIEAFLVWDYASSEFTFLTSTEEVEVQNFINYILAP